MTTVFSNKLQQIRKKYGLTQEELAQILMISRSHLAKLESGHVSPNTNIVKRIALQLNIPQSLLLDDTIEEIILPESIEFIDSALLCKYNLLEEDYKKFVLNQINQLLELQLKLAAKKES